MPNIEPGRLLTEEEANEVRAALALTGQTQKSFAVAKGRSYDRLNRMVARTETVTPDYATLLNGLVRRLRSRYATAA